MLSPRSLYSLQTSTFHRLIPFAYVCIIIPRCFVFACCVSGHHDCFPGEEAQTLKDPPTQHAEKIAQVPSWVDRWNALSAAARIKLSGIFISGYDCLPIFYLQRFLNSNLNSACEARQAIRKTMEAATWEAIAWKIQGVTCLLLSWWSRNWEPAISGVFPMFFHVFPCFFYFSFFCLVLRIQPWAPQGNSHTTNSANTTPRMKGSVENLDYVWHLDADDCWMISHDISWCLDDGAMCKITSSKTLSVLETRDWPFCFLYWSVLIESFFFPSGPFADVSSSAGPTIFLWLVDYCNVI